MAKRNPTKHASAPALRRAAMRMLADLPDPKNQKRGAMGGSAPHVRRTHWTRGKRRNVVMATAQEIAALIAHLARHRAMADAARRMGVPVKTLWKWRTGLHVPAPGRLAALREAAERVVPSVKKEAARG